MISRRNLLKGGLAVAGVAALSPQLQSRVLAQVVAPQTRLPGSAIPKFIDPLPLLSLAGGPMETVVAGADPIPITMAEFRAAVLPTGFAPPNGAYGGTWVWGYRHESLSVPVAGTYIGPVIVATRGTPTEVRWINELPTGRADSELLAYWNGTDQTLHWADPLNSGANQCAHAVTPGQPAVGVCASHYTGPVPAVPHLHGGEVPPVLDGGPDSWFTSDGKHHGHAYYPGPGGGGNTAVYRYPNSQEAAPAWFHDHVLGLTRLGVYAGLAGAYPIIDEGLDLPTGLHPVGLQQGSSGRVDHLIPLVIQSRAFDTAGQLFFDNAGINPEHPFWIPELVGDVNVVNGKAWPFLNVEPRRYRFLFVNGSNARAYEMFFTNPVTKVDGPAMWQIATDGGYLDAPVKIDPMAPRGQLLRLLLQPGERADVIVDFAGFAGQTLLLRNLGRHPFPNGTPPNGSLEGQVMVVRVGPGPVADASYDPASGIPLRPPMVRLVDPAAGALATGVTATSIRQLTLNEVMAAGGPLELLVNNTRWDGKSTDTSTFAGGVRPDFTGVTVNGTTEYFSELPEEGTTEVWEIVNLTADAHPIHTHLTQFQIMNRQKFNLNRYDAAYNAAFPTGVYTPGYGPPLDYDDGNPRALGGNPDITPYLQGAVRPPEPNEAGWKDVAIMYPGQVTRIAVRYAPTDTPAGAAGHFPFDPNAGAGHGYVMHCHIIDHEDNEMMRPLQVQPADVDRVYELGRDY